MPDADTERTSVRTYVPAYQKKEWQEHAEALDMSQSEFVRTMVQAGRRGFGDESEDPRSPDVAPGENDLETMVLDLLREDARSWEELHDAIVGDLEDRLDETLGDLQAENRVKYSGRAGGYVVDE